MKYGSMLQEILRFSANVCLGSCWELQRRKRAQDASSVEWGKLIGKGCLLSTIDILQNLMYFQDRWNNAALKVISANT